MRCRECPWQRMKIGGDKVMSAHGVMNTYYDSAWQLMNTYDIS